jgi:hypothetical protein
MMAQQYTLPNKNKRVEVTPPVRLAVPQGPTPGDPRGKIPVIRAAAEKYGVDPATALKVAKSEGLAQFYGDGGASGGAFQLYTKGGLGNEFQKETGLNPLDKRNEDATIDYAMKRAAQGGWGPWYGAAKVGVGQWDGIKAQDAPIDPTPNVGSGESDYKNTLVDPTPNVGSGESDYKTDDGEDKKDKKKKTNWGEAAGEGLENVGKAFAAGAKNVTANPANVPIPMLPMPQGPQPMIDPKRAEMQRQQLAIAMQRLNSGKLV